jgi:multidrug efflux pump subunit AcrA (membrane-fusion protein)
MKSKTFQIKVMIPYFEDIIQNMSASVNVPVSDKKKLKMIKRDALVLFQGKDFVYTVKEGKAAIMPVNVVTFLGDRVGVDTPYIVPGMKLVTEGNERLRPDQPVSIAGE